MTPRAFGFVPVLAATVLAAVMLTARPAAAQQGWATGAVGLSPVNFEAGGADVAFDAAGNGFAVYGLYDGTTVSVWLVHFDAALGAWRLPAMPLSPPGQWAQAPRIAFDAAGNALVVWVGWTDPVYELLGVRYSGATQTWSAPVIIATIGEGGAGPALAITPGGDALAIWTALTSSEPLGLGVFSARYLAASNAWAAAVPVSNPSEVAYLADVAMAPSGDAVAVWTVMVSETTEAAQTARFLAAAGTWQLPVTRSAATTFVEYTTVAVDGAGDAVVAWQRTPLVEVTRYDAGSDTWSAAAAISVGSVLDGPALASDADGNTVVLWRVSGGAVEATRYDATLAAWSTTQPLVGALGSGRPAVAMDPAGNAVAFWPSPALANGSGQGARFVRASGAWTAPETIATAGPPTMVSTAADGVGNVGVVWHTDSSTPVVYATRWSGAPRAPTITGLTATTTSVTVTLAPPVTTEPAFAPTAYEYSISIGPWTRVPLSSPLVITGLRVGTWYLSVRAVNAAGGGASASAPFSIAPDPPSHLAAVAVDGTRVTLAWQVPPGATTSFTYVVEGGLAPGEVLASLPTGSPAPTFTFTAPPGVFRVRVRTDYFQLRSAPSNEIVLGVAVPLAPSAPTSLLGLATGSALALAWTNSFAAGAPADVSLVVAGPVSGVVPLGLVDTFQFAGVPPGTYTFQVVAANAAGASPPSNAVTLTFPTVCSGAPAAPLRLTATRVDRTLTIAWSAPETGAAPTSYVLLVSGAFTGAFPLGARTISAPVPPGAYTFRVQAANACGLSAPTGASTVVVP